jgi:hypothetical protein
MDDDLGRLAPARYHSNIGTNAFSADVPGLNQIGAFLDDIRQRIQYHGKGSLREWIDAAKLIALAQDVHGLRGEALCQFATAHLGGLLEDKTLKTRQRIVDELYILGHAPPGQPANGDVFWSDVRRRRLSTHTSIGGPVGAKQRSASGTA